MKNKMEIGSVLTLDDNNKYLVSNETVYNDITYYLIVDLKDINNYKIVYIVGSDELESVEDPSLLERLFLIMTKNMLE